MEDVAKELAKGCEVQVQDDGEEEKGEVEENNYNDGR